MLFQGPERGDVPSHYEHVEPDTVDIEILAPHGEDTVELLKTTLPEGDEISVIDENGKCLILIKIAKINRTSE